MNNRILDSEEFSFRYSGKICDSSWNCLFNTISFLLLDLIFFSEGYFHDILVTIVCAEDSLFG